ncbi:LYR motif-containing protein 4 isoform X1 [Passer domesticus]|uniref:LYR motif-containing protein 4 isoform X1 n=1 Tax=Passer domesticus TaxID=48849 RepID=UPI0030FEE83D
MYPAIPRQLAARITCCSFPAPTSISPRQHPPPPVQHTALPPSTASERCFRFPRRPGLPSPPAGPPQPHGRARQAPPGQSRRGIPAGAAGQARPGGTREPTPSAPSPPAPGLPRPGAVLARPPRASRWARAEPRPLPLRAATHRRPCGSAPPRLRPARPAGGRGKGASPREERLGVGNMAASSRAQVLRLYRALLRESQRFSGYSYRNYAIRRIKDAFRENKNIADSEKIEELLNKAKANLEVIQRQVLKSVGSPGNEGIFVAFTGTLPKERRKRKMLFGTWRFGDSEPRMMAEQEKRNLWISSITENKINKEIIFMILSGTDDCSLVIGKILPKK